MLAVISLEKRITVWLGFIIPIFVLGPEIYESFTRYLAGLITAGELSEWIYLLPALCPILVSLHILLFRKTLFAITVIAMFFSVLAALAVGVLTYGLLDGEEAIILLLPIFLGYGLLIVLLFSFPINFIVLMVRKILISKHNPKIS